MNLFYDGIQYEVENEGDMEPINLLAEDENEDNTQVSNNSKDFQESNWTPEVMHLFLDECIKRKMLIRDPKIQGHKVFFAIHKQMKAKGYNFKVITLERKLRTMKKHYMVVSENNRNPSLKRSYWQYYEKLKTLYPDCLNQRSIKVTQPLAKIPEQKLSPSAPPIASFCKKTKPADTFSNTNHASQESLVTQLILKDYSSSALSGFTFVAKEKHQTMQDRNKNFEKPADIEILRKEILTLEERRTVATEKILIELRKSNKLKEEMLELNIKLFEATKQMDEY